MNNTRRKEVQRTLSKVYKAIQLLDEVRCEFEDIACNEGEAFDNIPENLQNSERYAQSETALESLNDAYDVVDEIFDNLMDLTTEVEEACGIL